MTGNSNSVNFLAEQAARIDVHVLAILVFLAPLSLLGLPLNLALVLIFAVPQLRLLTHAYGCYSEGQRSPTSYLVLNEVVLAMLLALCWVLGRLIA